MKPGKKSAASLEVVAPPAPMARVEPSPDLTPRECDLWREIVRSLPADWFRPADLPLLAAYCQAASEHEEASRILASDGFMLAGAAAKYRHPMLAVRHQAALRMGALASKMRLCPSARYDKFKASSATSGATPSAAKAVVNIAPPWLGKVKN